MVFQTRRVYELVVTSAFTTTAYTRVLVLIGNRRSRPRQLTSLSFRLRLQVLRFLLELALLQKGADELVEEAKVCNESESQCSSYDE